MYMRVFFLGRPDTGREVAILLVYIFSHTHVNNQKRKALRFVAEELSRQVRKQQHDHMLRRRCATDAQPLIELVFVLSWFQCIPT